MSLEQKLQFFQFLVEMGFKTIEISFPAASDTEFELTRYLIEHDLIPDDVAIQVLTQSRDHIIETDFRGVERREKRCRTSVQLHLYPAAGRRVSFFKKAVH